MYNFLFDSTYINLLIIALIIFLIMFLWRKLTVLEGNFFILEKRVNSIKKENRETGIVKNLEKSNMAMNEIFNDIIPDKCIGGICSKSSEMCNIPLKFDTDKCDAVPTSPITPTKMVIEDSENVKISFASNDDITKKIEDAMDNIDIINTTDNDNVSVVSEFTLNTDEKLNNKKLSKMNLEKLKATCVQLNISTEGNKAQLISRILECNK